jgi:hypothetical protein
VGLTRPWNVDAIAQMRRSAISIVVALIASLSATASAKDFDQAKICEAIREGLELRVFYRAGESERVVIPRFLGYTRARNLILNGLQVSGFSESGNLPGHRSFRLDRATDIQFTANVAPSQPSSGKLPSGIVELVCARH